MGFELLAYSREALVAEVRALAAAGQEREPT